MKPHAFPSRQELAAALDYDPATGVFRWKAPTSPRWRGTIGQVAGGKDGNGYILIKFAGKQYKAHHLAWIFVHGEMHLMPQTDHRDGDRCNNAIANLRPCSHAENQANQRSRPAAGLPKGVRQSKRGKPFTVRIRFQRRLLHVGTCDTVEEAARAYLTAAKQLYGEFARQDAVAGS